MQPLICSVYSERYFNPVDGTESTLSNSEGGTESTRFVNDVELQKDRSNEDVSQASLDQVSYNDQVINI